jgi:nucleoside-diphosphate-sugar epimerase
MLKVSVTGASGFIGEHLISKLLILGYSIKILSRKNHLYNNDNIEVVKGDLLEPSIALNYFVEDCDVLFHCAGETRNIKLMNDLHVNGTRNLLNAIYKRNDHKSRKVHWVQLSSVGVYGKPLLFPSEERVIDENSQFNPFGEYEISKLSSDMLVVEAGEFNYISYSIVRPSNVIGLDMRSVYFFQMIKAIQLRYFFYIGKKGAVATYVQVNDVVEALVRCATMPNAVNQVFNLSYDCTLESLVEAISMNLGVSPSKIRFSEKFIRLIVIFLSWFTSSPLTSSRIDSLVSRTRYPSDKIIKNLGFTFSKPIPVSIKEIINKYLGKR